MNETTLKPIRWSTVLLVAIIGASIAWIAFMMMDSLGKLLVLPPAIAVAGGLVTVVVGGVAWRTNQRLRVRRERVEPAKAVLLLLVGRASILAGFTLAGAYLGVAAFSARRFSAVLPKERFFVALVGALFFVGLGFAGRALERACRIPYSDDNLDEDDDNAGRERETPGP